MVTVYFVVCWECYNCDVWACAGDRPSWADQSFIATSAWPSCIVGATYVNLMSKRLSNSCLLGPNDVTSDVSFTSVVLGGDAMKLCHGFIAQTLVEQSSDKHHTLIRAPTSKFLVFEQRTGRPVPAKNSECVAGEQHNYDVIISSLWHGGAFASCSQRGDVHG